MNCKHILHKNLEYCVLCGLKVISKTMNDNPVSSCCKAEMRAACGDEGTCCFICQECHKPCDMESGARDKIHQEYENAMNREWEEVFDQFYDKNEQGGSSRWLVSPSTVKMFIKGLLKK